MRTVIKTEINNIMIIMYEDMQGFTVLYGCDKQSTDTIEHALIRYNSCVEHALLCDGVLTRDEEE